MKKYIDKKLKFYIVTNFLNYPYFLISDEGAKVNQKSVEQYISLINLKLYNKSKDKLIIIAHTIFNKL